MKTIMLGASAAVFLAAAGASAADLPSRKYTEAPVAYVPAFTWNGFYVGLNAGYAWGTHKTPYTFFTTSDFDLAVIPTGFLPASANNDQSGFIGGAQAGYNIQYNQFVLGVEGDLNYVGGSKSKGFASVDQEGGQSFTAVNKADLNWLGTLRARAGFALDRALIYATGGLAFGGVESRTNFAFFFNPDFASPADAVWAGDKSETGVGWTLGAGVEYAFTNNWTAKVEYLYYDLGDITYNLNDIDRLGFTATVKQEFTGNIVRAGVNYKF